MDRAQAIGLFRWQIVGEATDVSLSARERGRLVRALAEREHLAPDGRWVRVGRNTLDRWIRAYREGGFDGLVPAPRRVANATSERLLELAVALRSTIDGMDRKETGEYIAHHVKLAGRSDTIFSDDAAALIHDASRGLPRAVNNLATQTLIAAYASNKSICDESSARAARAEITRRMTGEIISLFDQQPAPTEHPRALALPPPPADWPAAPDPAAHYGLAGQVVAKIAPHTEADRATRGRTLRVNAQDRRVD